MKINGKAMFVLLLALLIVSCAPAAPQAGGASPVPSSPGPSAAKTEEKPVSGGTLVRAMTTEPATLDPQGAPNSGLSLVIPYLFDTLVVRDVHNQLLPQLAESWQIAQDGKAITMKLRSGVTFHDGTALDAEAVRFTFQRFKETGQKSPIYSGIQQIAGVEAVDNLTVRFSFKEPAANFWSTISMPYA
ncbi:MAG TPA: ABC transporter substrate-binding protein, partial [Anaerolineae bacterium]